MAYAAFPAWADANCTTFVAVNFDRGIDSALALVDQASAVIAVQASAVIADRASAVIDDGAIDVVKPPDSVLTMVDIQPNVFAAVNYVVLDQKTIVVFVIEAIATATMRVAVDSSIHLDSRH